jgi:hypothetical protein
MRTTVLAITLLLFVATMAHADDITCDRAVVSQAWELLKLGGYGTSDFEQAAFIVRDADGQHRFVIWPFERRYHHATLHGPIPAGAVAIIHTHPNSVPLPSLDDAELAHHLHLTVYVVTRMAISRTRDRREVEIVRNGDWNPEAPRGAAPSSCAAPTTIPFRAR